MACRGFFECVLKLLNLVVMAAGLAMMGYGAYLLVVWLQVPPSPPLPPAVAPSGELVQFGRPLLLLLDVSLPDGTVERLSSAWFIFAFIGVGVILFITSIFGCAGASTRSGCCLSFYSFLIILFILVELAAGGFIFFNRSWKEVIPVDKTGNFDMIYSFLKDNWRIAKWVALGAVVFEGFGGCPEDADDATVTYHCRAWVLHMFGAVLFPDATGDAASWMYIHCLQDWGDARQFSWGSAVLAFLYRQLCEACRRTAPTSTLGGCIFLLQVWMWTRILVGRPRVFQSQPWHPQGVDDLGPTVACLWDSVSVPFATTERAYVDFSNELDTLSRTMVSWEPYSEPQVAALPLSTMCRRDYHLWRMRCPLICFYAVEIHLPHRVARQFGLVQFHPPE